MYPSKTAGVLVSTSLLLLGVTAPLAGQWRSEPVVRPAATESPAADPPALRLPDFGASPPPDEYTLVMAGIAGAAVGTLGGAYLGYHVDDKLFHRGCQQGCFDAGYTGILVGWFVGSALTTPLSVHLANGRRGSLSHAYISSAVITAAGFGCLAVGCVEGGLAVFATPVVQVISAVLIERRIDR